MGKSQDYTERFEKLLMPVLNDNGFELYDTEYVKEGSQYYLRAYIDKPGGITIDDCETVSRYISDRLDEDDFINEAYILEVSSPGLGRQLKKDRHFEKSIGEEVEIHLYKGIPETVKGREQICKEWTGILKGFDRDSIVIENEDREISFERKNVALARLMVRW